MAKSIGENLNLGFLAKVTMELFQYENRIELAENASRNALKHFLLEILGDCDGEKLHWKKKESYKKQITYNGLLEELDRAN